MKLMIASDIHGSSFYCRLLLEAFKIEQPNKLLLLGDILYHGPRNDLPEEYNPKEVISMLNGIKNSILCVRGNCEAEVDQMVFEFPCLADYAVLYFNDKTLYATHGHVYNKDRIPPLSKGEIMLFGHTHIPEAFTVEDKLLLNPGSVSLPKAESEHSYMIFDENGFFWKTLDGCIYKQLLSGRC